MLFIGIIIQAVSINISYLQPYCTQNMPAVCLREWGVEGGGGCN